MSGYYCVHDRCALNLVAIVVNRSDLISVSLCYACLDLKSLGSHDNRAVGYAECYADCLRVLLRKNRYNTFCGLTLGRGCGYCCRALVDCINLAVIVNVCNVFV